MANTTFNGPVRSENGFQTITKSATTGAVAVTATFGVATTVTDLVYRELNHPTTAAINATATATAAQVATGYITSTSAAATTITLPTGTLLGAAIGATQGTVLDLYIDNTGGASTVTIAVAVNGILSSAAADTAGSFGDLTVAAGATGLARYTLMFSSATAYVFTRTA
tara:strand:- start:10742 stop:11245 length:504 start_codon:yes stop_codon:yes gene_type:complete